MTANDILKREQAKAKRDELVLHLLSDMEALGLPEPTREFPFSAKIGRRHRADIAYPFQHLLIEVQGGQWVKSRHRTGTGYEKDCERLNIGTLLGFRWLWFTTSQVKNGEAVPVIAEALGVELPEA